MASTNGRMKRKSWKVISIHFWFRFSGTHTTKEFELNEWIKIDTDIELHSNCPMVVQRDFVSRLLLLLPPLLLFYMCAWFTFLDFFFFFFVWWTVERAHTGNNKHFSTCDWSEKGAHKRKRSFSFHHAKSKRVKYIGLNRMNWMCIKTSIFIHFGWTVENFAAAIISTHRIWSDNDESWIDTHSLNGTQIAMPQKCFSLWLLCRQNLERQFDIEHDFINQ